jgi:hypothetical protein
MDMVNDNLRVRAHDNTWKSLLSACLVAWRSGGAATQIIVEMKTCCSTTCAWTLPLKTPGRVCRGTMHGSS